MISTQQPILTNNIRSKIVFQTTRSNTPSSSLVACTLPPAIIHNILALDTLQGLPQIIPISNTFIDRKNGSEKLIVALVVVIERIRAHTVTEILRYIDGTLCRRYNLLSIVGSEKGCCLFHGTLVGVEDVPFGNGEAVGVVCVGWIDG